MASKSDILFLVGMPGSGKSYWARTISENYRIPFLDMDNLIEVQENKSIKDIFEHYGEDYFRKKEHETIEHVVNSTNGSVIISVGGGAPCFYGNMQLMNEYGTTVYLKASIRLLAENLKNKTAHRPLFKNGAEELDKKIDALLQAREYYYEQAHYIVDADRLSLNTFATILNKHV